MSKPMAVPAISNPKTATQISTWVREKFGDDPTYDDALQAEIDKWNLPWFRAGAVVVDYTTGKILMMHEARVQVKKIKDAAQMRYYLDVEHLKPNSWVDGDGGWNLPSGRLKPGETFEEGLIREVVEESGHRIEIQNVIDVRIGNKPDNLYIMPVWVARAVSGPTNHKTAETSEIGWFTTEEIRAMNDAGDLRSPDFVMNALSAYEKYLAEH